MGKSKKIYILKTTRKFICSRVLFLRPDTSKSVGIIIPFPNNEKKTKNVRYIVDNIEKYADEYLFLLLFAAIALLL